MMFLQNMPFDEDPEEPVHIRIRKRLDHAFDSDLLFDIGISEAGQQHTFIETSPARTKQPFSS
jgi:hypothetical protein